ALAQGAMSLLVRYHDNISLLAQQLHSLIVITPSEVSYVNCVTRAVAQLRKIKLDADFTTSARIDLEKTLEVLQAAIQGRTLGVIPTSGMRVKRGPDWHLGDED